MVIRTSLNNEELVGAWPVTSCTDQSPRSTAILFEILPCHVAKCPRVTQGKPGWSHLNFLQAPASLWLLLYAETTYLFCFLWKTPKGILHWLNCYFPPLTFHSDLYDMVWYSMLWYAMLRYAMLCYTIVRLLGARK